MTPIYKGNGYDKAGFTVFIEGDKSGRINTSVRIRFIHDSLKAHIRKHHDLILRYTESAEGHDIAMLVFLRSKGDEIIADVRLETPLTTPEYNAFKELFRGKEIAFYL